MRIIEKREFAWEFSQLSCPGQTRMRVESWEAKVCMRVFSTIMSWSNEDESWWELRSESLYENFLNYHVLVKRGWELRSESLHENFLNYYALVKRGWELMRVEKRKFVWEFSQLSCPGQTRMRVDESWEARVCIRVFSTLRNWLILPVDYQCYCQEKSSILMISFELIETFKNIYVHTERKIS